MLRLLPVTMLLNMAIAPTGAAALAMESPSPQIVASSVQEECPDALSIALMARVKLGDADAFERLVVMHQAAVIGTVAKMLGDSTEAHDIAQMVFLRVWRSAGRYRPSAKFTTWLFTITRNLVFNESRRRSRRRALSAQELEDEHQLQIPDRGVRTPDDAVENAELWRAIDEAIAGLPEKQRLAIILRRYEDMPYEEIAKVLGGSVASVKSLLFRARSDLKARLQNYLDA